MSGNRFNYSSERQRHEKFVGHAGLLTRLDQLLTGGEPRAETNSSAVAQAGQQAG